MYPETETVIVRGEIEAPDSYDEIPLRILADRRIAVHSIRAPAETIME
jgi:hypothetical protein